MQIESTATPADPRKRVVLVEDDEAFRCSVERSLQIAGDRAIRKAACDFLEKSFGRERLLQQAQRQFAAVNCAAAPEAWQGREIERLHRKMKALGIDAASHLRPAGIMMRVDPPQPPWAQRI